MDNLAIKQLYSSISGKGGPFLHLRRIEKGQSKSIKRWNLRNTESIKSAVDNVQLRNTSPEDIIQLDLCSLCGTSTPTVELVSDVLEFEILFSFYPTECSELCQIFKYCGSCYKLLVRIRKLHSLLLEAREKLEDSVIVFRTAFRLRRAKADASSINHPTEAIKAELVEFEPDQEGSEKYCPANLETVESDEDEKPVIVEDELEIPPNDESCQSPTSIADKDTEAFANNLESNTLGETAMEPLSLDRVELADKFPDQRDAPIIALGIRTWYTESTALDSDNLPPTTQGNDKPSCKTAESDVKKRNRGYGTIDEIYDIPGFNGVGLNALLHSALEGEDFQFEESKNFNGYDGISENAEVGNVATQSGVGESLDTDSISRCNAESEECITVADDDSPVYNCTKCALVFTRLAKLKLHIQSHGNEDNDVEAECKENETRSREGSTISSLDNEFDTESSEDYSDSDDLSATSRVVSGSALYLCVICKQEFDVGYQFEKHHNAVHPGKRISCSECRQRYAQFRGLQRHQKKCSKFKRRLKKFRLAKENSSCNLENGACGHLHSCTLCKVECLGSKAMEVHFETAHPGQTPYSYCTEGSNIPISKTHKEEENLECGVCSQRFFLQSAFDAHMTTHYAAPEKCPDCELTVNGMDELEKHKRAFHQQDLLIQFSCPKCPAKFKTNGALSRHKGRSHPQGDMRPKRCNECGVWFRFRVRYEQHVHKEDGSAAYRCCHCKEEYEKWREMERHLAKSHGAYRKPRSRKKAQCEACGLVILKERLPGHMRNVHPKDPNERKKCLQCNQEFATVIGKRKHDQEVHGARDLFQCYFCGRTCLEKCVLENHMGNHTKEGLECRICRKWMANRSTLKTHMTLVCGVDEEKREELRKKRREDMAKFRAMKVYKCTNCEASYGQKAMLVSHKRRCKPV